MDELVDAPFHPRILQYVLARKTACDRKWVWTVRISKYATRSWTRKFTAFAAKRFLKALELKFIPI